MHRHRLAIAAFCLAAHAAHAAPFTLEPVGETEMVRPGATRQPDDTATETPLIERQTLFTRDTLATDSHAAVHVRFRDETELRLGENSRVMLDDFVYRRTSADRMALSVVKGAARFITGRIGSDRVGITTPVMHIGVRGTDLSILVRDDGSTIVSVTEGQVEIDTTGGLNTLVNAGETVAIPADGESIRHDAAPAPADPGLAPEGPMIVAYRARSR